MAESEVEFTAEQQQEAEVKHQVRKGRKISFKYTKGGPGGACIGFKYGIAVLILQFERNRTDVGAIENGFLDALNSSQKSHDDSIFDDTVATLICLLECTDLKANPYANVRVGLGLAAGQIVPRKLATMESSKLALLPRQKLANLVIVEAIETSEEVELYKVELAGGPAKAFLVYRTACLWDRLQKLGVEVTKYARLQCEGLTCFLDIIAVVYIDDDMPVGYLTPWYDRGTFKDNFEASYAEKCKWTTNLVDALVTLEPLGYTHPELHLDNVLVADDGSIKLQELPQHKANLDQVWALGKTDLELTSGKPSDNNSEDEHIKTAYPGIIGELVYKYCGVEDVATVMEVKTHLQSCGRVVTRSRPR